MFWVAPVDLWVYFGQSPTVSSQPGSWRRLVPPAAAQRPCSSTSPPAGQAPAPRAVPARWWWRGTATDGRARSVPTLPPPLTPTASPRPRKKRSGPRVSCCCVTSSRRTSSCLPSMPSTRCSTSTSSRSPRLTVVKSSHATERHHLISRQGVSVSSYGRDFQTGMPYLTDRLCLCIRSLHNHLDPAQVWPHQRRD